MDDTPVLSSPSHEAVASAVRGWLALGTYAPGERLPSERALAETFGVGRVTVRRALRELAAAGLVATSRGRQGGTYVQERRAAGQAMGSLELERVVRDSFEFRLAVEPMAASLAAGRAAAAVREQIARLGDGTAGSFGEYRAIDSRFHIAVAEASGNALLLEAVSRSRTHFFGWADAIRRRTVWEDLTPEERDFRAHHHHIAAAILAADEQQARDLMAAHLQAGMAQYLGFLRALGAAGA